MIKVLRSKYKENLQRESGRVWLGLNMDGFKVPNSRCLKLEFYELRGNTR